MERKRKIRLIYLFAESSAAPQLTNLSTAASRHLVSLQSRQLQASSGMALLRVKLKSTQNDPVIGTICFLSFPKRPKSLESVQ